MAVFTVFHHPDLLRADILPANQVLYNIVARGEATAPTDAALLESIFEATNRISEEQPPWYEEKRGGITRALPGARSTSIGDVVSIMDDDITQPVRFFRCESDGFKEIPHPAFSTANLLRLR